jgi:hypothetical protein
MTRMTYEIRVEGQVPNEVLENFEGVTFERETLDTTLRADLADAAALHGLLLALRRAGAVLLEVRRDLGQDYSAPADLIGMAAGAESTQTSEPQPRSAPQGDDGTRDEAEDGWNQGESSRGS